MLITPCSLSIGAGAKRASVGATSHQPHRCTRYKTLSVLCDKAVSGRRVVTGLCAI